MSDAPERIWAEPYGTDHPTQNIAGRWTAKPRFPELPQQYVRADLYEQQAARIKELEDTLREVRSHMEMRMVHGFDFQTGEYPVTSETIEVLCTENNELRKEIERLKAELEEARANAIVSIEWRKPE